MRLPGDNYTALIEAGSLAHPYQGMNELDSQWIGREDWSVSRTFDADEEFLQASWLTIEGLDTIGDVYLNGTKAASSRNMFSRLRVDVHRLLRIGTNEIRILFRSAEVEAARLARALPYPVPHSRFPVQSENRNLVRKVQCHSGWDWGPCLMVSGVYGPLTIESSRFGRIEYLTTRQKAAGRDRRLEVTVEYTALAEGILPLAISVGGAELSEQVRVRSGANRITRRLVIKKPELWWPAGYGGQPLYELSVTLGDATIVKRIGFRDIRVVSRDDRHGRSMYFQVNGRDLFAKGANWIPCDALPSGQSRSRYEHLLRSAVAANMNMLRVWGGGQYEADVFYELCDELGILIWQDMMFSCSLYPAQPDFLDLVREEVAHQVRRLKDHPSLALWCGNNENVGALNWYEESRRNRDRYLVDYDRLNEGVIGRVLDEHDPDRVFWPSSPSAGRNDYTDCWHVDNRGDMHYWSVWHEGRPFTSYYEVTPRFCSEFGFQSFPSYDGVRSYASEDEMNLTSPTLEHHQRHPRGNAIIIESMSRYFRFPYGLKNMLYLSQVQQAFAIRTAVEYWRSRRPICMGALYWQLNDTWPVASWSSIEHSGKWKLLHYAARKFFAPLHIMGWSRDGRDFEIWAVNDTDAAVEGSLTARILDFSGNTLWEHETAVSLRADGALRAARFRPEDLGIGTDEGFLDLRLRAPGLLAENQHFMCFPKRCAIERAGIEWNASSGPHGVELTLWAEKPAFSVALDAEGLAGSFSDNLFNIQPGERKTIRFTPAANLAVFRRALKIYDLRGSYE